MPIKDLLVHLDETPASTTRLQATLTLAATCGAQVSALYLVAEPFLPGMGGRHLPAELLREHLAHAEAEAETLLKAARTEADRHGVTLDIIRESGPLDRLPHLLARHARHTDLTIVGQPDLAAHGVDDTALTEAAFMDSGHPALVIPRAGTAGPATATGPDRLGRLARSGPGRQRRDPTAAFRRECADPGRRITGHR